MADQASSEGVSAVDRETVAKAMLRANSQAQIGGEGDWPRWETLTPRQQAKFLHIADAAIAAMAHQAPPARDERPIDIGGESVPRWVVEYADALTTYHAERGGGSWAVGGVQSREAQPVAVPADAVQVFNCHRCPVSVEARWQPPECPECGDPCVPDASAKPAPLKIAAVVDGTNASVSLHRGESPAKLAIEDDTCRAVILLAGDVAASIVTLLGGNGAALVGRPASLSPDRPALAAPAVSEVPRG